MINIFIDIQPLPAPRPRFTRFRATYNPQKYTDYKEQIAFLAKEKVKTPFVNEVALHLDFFFKYPKCWGAKKKQSISWHTTKPDLDNLIKSILDALNKVAFLDDKQVVSIQARKQYAASSGVKIELIEI